MKYAILNIFTLTKIAKCLQFQLIIKNSLFHQKIKIDP